MDAMYFSVSIGIKTFIRNNQKLRSKSFKLLFLLKKHRNPFIVCRTQIIVITA